MKGNKILTAGFTGSRERANSAVDELLELGEDFIADLDDGSRFWHPFRGGMRLRHTVTNNGFCCLPASFMDIALSRFWHPFSRGMRLRHTTTNNRLCRLPASLEESVRKITAGKDLV